MSQLWTMVASDLRQRVRDRSFFIFALGVPLALMYVFNLAFGSLMDAELKPVTVAVAAPASDPAAGTLVAVLDHLDGLDVTVHRGSVGEVRDRTRGGGAALGVIVPEGFGAAVSLGRPTTVEVIEGEGSGIETDVLISALRTVLDRYAAGAVASAAGARLGLAPDELARVGEQAATAGPGLTLTQGTASNEQLGTAASLVAGQSGLFLLFTVGFGVLGLVTERQLGTLARLRSMPMPPGHIVAAKAVVSFLLGVVATAVLLTVGGRLFSVSFGSPLAVAVLVVCAVAAATSLMFVIARVARTAEQANIAQSIVAMALGIAGGAFTPISATGALARVLDLNPVAAFIRGLGITSGGGGLADIGQPLLYLLGFAVLAGVLSRVLPDRGAGA
ncbi:MAG TPA: ABC transporter permease [Intrasporangium sp.]|uniref:ABC transporter permease n=1 Tax=Intrasporangium sp. TaxID=1925024 RepID=UPI002D798A1E|nr:ABC transporter permease [Intrasporangium sp.]HET7398162.1 ABC transporter permease [Intrasporangium sp.]